ncbi:MAG: PA14 domain-containing protein, partial [Candidatus Brocadiia bacterium]
PLYSETYTFTTRSDDGVRLWVNGQSVIDNWTDHGPTYDSGTIALSAGTKYDIQLDYYENGGGAVIELYWSSASQAEEIIPQSQLYSVAGLPSPWQSQDVGSPGAAGNASSSGGTFTVEGDGDDIWNNSDNFHFAYRSLSGDGEIEARVASLENTNSWAKAGVMIRESLTGGSKHAMMALTPGNGAAFQYRTTTDGSSSHAGGSAVTPPYWVRLVRSGDTLTGYESSDGSSWTEVGSATISMATDVYIGLPVTSHSDGVLCTAEIDNVTVTP